MIMVNIFTTSPLGGPQGDFQHGGVTFTFDLLVEDTPRRLVEGPMYAFVDWALPGISGLEMCRRLRANPRTAYAHLTLVLEEDDPEDNRRALKAGADDYMVGPLDRTRVLDRVLALFSERQDHHAARTVVAGGLVIDLVAFQARWRGNPIRLAPNEFRLLRFLAENPNKAHSRQDIIKGLGKGYAHIGERTVDVWMKRLRPALQEAGMGDAIRTIRMVGYCLDVT
ncbi:response regulator transcription factor [Croceibacterium sp. LX-88]|jgi:two-component system phosphate regulon response regulator PhoB|uniref:Response regulator transcription factor n=1 Tax=Croceibacterium selenioxidans TaxID=2838833 RepID=A0ABS5W1H8_9SPHN|nr:response regulator transcription factor [Croceibacterium selenioxidans]MBT2133177.1 response regulator transcription factor [Croceibacterium selenioxidans]